MFASVSEERFKHPLIERGEAGSSIFLFYILCIFPKLFPNNKHNLTFPQGFTCLKWPLSLCTGVCRPSAPRPTTSARPSAWPEPPSSSAAPTCRPWCECCRSEDSSPLLMPGLSASRRPAACRPRRASWSHGQSSSVCRCPARTRDDGRGKRGKKKSQCKDNEDYKWCILTHLKEYCLVKDIREVQGVN